MIWAEKYIMVNREIEMTKKDCKYYFEITDTLGYMDEDCWGNPSIDMVQQLF